MPSSLMLRPQTVQNTVQSWTEDSRVTPTATTTTLSRVSVPRTHSGRISRLNLMLSPAFLPQQVEDVSSPVSPLRLICPLEDRLRLWRPLVQGISGEGSHLSKAEVDRVFNVLSASWQTSTKRTYGAGLLLFHSFCDRKSPPIPEASRAPIGAPLLLDFLTACAGVYAGTTVKNYAYGLKAWHTVHALAWTISDDQLNAALSAAEKMTPSVLRRPERAPVTVVYLTQLAPHFDMTVPLDCAVFACLTTVFWSLSRLGEFVVPAVKSFDPGVHVKVRDMQRGAVSRLNLCVTTFHLPSTKTAPVTGESVQWSRQEGAADPEQAMARHLRVNNPGLDDHLFGWRSPKGHITPLSRTSFLRRVNSAVTAAGVDCFQGHSLRIGGVLEFLLRGVPFDVVKTMGRWSSDAFSLYLRKHAAILAPYIQDVPVLEPFTRIAMPQRLR
ncbi:hypothetical protein CVT24_012854 [Panaeolus cyanescens]|uniref:Tyr recombinase domain-containing protein n=1 Tax=Panaeolus cyanescens TaxID=181874 RepID=A0A409WUK3_9AGAR|nr:hypothetical protein CVT24_012854 [Panaeolus cyanescens]